MTHLFHFECWALGNTVELSTLAPDAEAARLAFVEFVESGGTWLEPRSTEAVLGHLATTARITQVADGVVLLTVRR